MSDNKPKDNILSELTEIINNLLMNPVSGQTPQYHKDISRLIEIKTNIATGQLETTASDICHGVSIRLYDVEFGQDCKAGMRIKNNELEVVGAMNGYGDSINLERIKVSLLDEC